jgi:hypothetical protein
MTLARIVARERARRAGVIAGAGLGAAVAAALGIIALASIALADGGWIARPAAPLAAWALAVAAIVAGAVLTARSLHRRATPAAVSRAVERERGLRTGALRAAAETASSGPFGRRAAELMAERIDALGPVLAPVALRGEHRRLGAMLLALIAAAGVAGVAAAGSPDGWKAMLSPRRAYAGTLLPPIVIKGARRDVLRGDTVSVVIAAPGRTGVTLRSRPTGAAWRDTSLVVEYSQADAIVGPLDADITLVATDGRALSDTLVIHVRDRAFVGEVAVEAVYPAYLARAPEPLAAGEPLRVPRGTELRIEARASADLASAGLVRDGSRDTLRFSAHGRRARGRLEAGAGGTWRWYASGAGGPMTDVPAPLEVETVPDARPRAEILAPAADTVLAADATVTLRLAASDDHGLARAILRSWRETNGRMMPAAEQLVAQPAAPAWAGEVMLDLAPRALEPGDALHVLFIVTDDSPWQQTGQSRELVIRRPTMAEARALARALGDSVAARTANAASAERDLAQRTQEAARTRSDRAPNAEGRRAASFETAERAASLAHAQEQLTRQVRDAQRDAAALERALQAAGVLDTTLARQLRDAQKMLNEALTPEMARQLAAVMSASKRLSPEEMRRALEQLAAQQEKLRAELERTAGMLRRAALEGAMQTLRDDARELAKQSHEVADSMARRDTSARGQAAAVSERSRALAAQIAQFGERLAREQAPAAASAMPSAAEHANRAAQEMSGAARSPSPDASARGAREGASQMDQAAQQLGDARERQVAAWKEGLTSELDRAAAEAMELSKAESELAARANAGRDSALRGDQSAVQQGVDRLEARLGRAAGQSAHVSPESQRALAEARSRVAEATRGIAESRRGGREASPDLEAASQALASAAAQMMRDRARAAGAQSASGFAELMQRMAEMAKQQGGINSQSAGLLPAPGAAPGAMQMEAARALARQQRALARSMDEAGAGEARAAQMAREMREIAAQLERGQVDPALLQRQQQLFHRLLDSGLAMEKEEREDTGRRESRTAADAAAFAPAAGSANGRAASAYAAPSWNELRSLTADERQAVLDYFNRLDRAANP